MKRLFTLGLALPLLFTGDLLACRYSVRDTGFVDLGEGSYRLILSGRDLGALPDLYRPLAATSIFEANMSFSVRQEPGMGEPTLTLESPDDQRLLINKGVALPTDALGAKALLESVATSLSRVEILDGSLNAFAAVVMVEGSRASDNTRVRNVLEAAIQEVSRMMSTMPKPVTTPPILVRITRERLAHERVALWGLGFDPDPAADPRVAIVFGRGRRLGSPLEGPLITQTAVQERLVIIGQDCECELDRAWMKGPVMPARWDALRQAQSARSLGFDPENPLVRTEISRIVLRGPGEGQRKRSPKAPLALGYSEIALDDLSAPAPEVPETSESAAPSTDSPATAPAQVQGNGSANRFEGLRRVLWAVTALASAMVLGLAALWWRRIGREHG